MGIRFRNGKASAGRSNAEGRRSGTLGGTGNGVLYISCTEDRRRQRSQLKAAQRLDAIAPARSSAVVPLAELVAADSVTVPIDGSVTLPFVIPSCLAALLRRLRPSHFHCCLLRTNLLPGARLLGGFLNVHSVLRPTDRSLRIEKLLAD